MQVASEMLSLMSVIAFTIGIIWLVVQAFRKSIWWGLGVMLLLPIAVFVFPFLQGKRSLRPVLLIISSILLFIAFAAAQQNISGMLVVALLLFGGVVYAYFKAPHPGRLVTDDRIPTLAISQASQSQVATTTEQPAAPRRFAFAFHGSGKTPLGSMFEAGHYDELIAAYQDSLRPWPNLPKGQEIAKLSKNKELLTDLQNFNDKHFSTILENRKVKKINWQDERFQLFFQIMNKKYGVVEPTINVLMLCFHDSNAYKQYIASFDETIAQSAHLFMREIVLRDIYTESSPNYRYIARLAQNVGIKLKRKTVDELYNATKAEIKLQQFEKHLQDSSNKPYISVEQQIKTEKQLEAINSKLSSFMSLALTDYIIVGPDYSRDSRLDNQYKARFSYALSKAFNGHCCRCGEGMGQLEFDHCWWPKSKGGNFVMRHRSGVYVNNCIPLCRSCNSSKSNKDFREFFSEEEISRIMEISQSLNAYINEQMADYNDTEFVGRAY
jgi:hypothetical protein